MMLEDEDVMFAFLLAAGDVSGRWWQLGLFVFFSAAVFDIVVDFLAEVALYKWKLSDVYFFYVSWYTQKGKGVFMNTFLLHFVTNLQLF